MKAALIEAANSDREQRIYPALEEIAYAKGFMYFRDVAQVYGRCFPRELSLVVVVGGGNRGSLAREPTVWSTTVFRIVIDLR